MKEDEEKTMKSPQNVEEALKIFQTEKNKQNKYGQWI